LLIFTGKKSMVLLVLKPAILDIQAGFLPVPGQQRHRVPVAAT